MRPNQKLFTRDGRKIGNCFVLMAYTDTIVVVDERGINHTISRDDVKRLFYLDDSSNEENIYNSIIELTKEGGMTFSILRSICVDRIKETKGVEA